MLPPCEPVARVLMRPIAYFSTRYRRSRVVPASLPALEQYRCRCSLQKKSPPASGEQAGLKPSREWRGRFR